MPVKTVTLSIPTNGPNAYPITELVQEVISDSGFKEGIVNVFCRHTTCSLMIMEASDPAAWTDLINYMNRLVPMNYSGFTHKVEGLDDMPSHIKTALTRTNELIPFKEGRLSLGTWQSLFLWEHRIHGTRREIVLSIIGE